MINRTLLITGQFHSADYKQDLREGGSYLTENDLVSPNQFGFRLKSSTLTAASQLSDHLLDSMNNGCLTGAVFLDLGKAFDTVNHTILLQKLSKYDADDAFKAWFTSFFTSRKQVTSYNGAAQSCLCFDWRCSRLYIRPVSIYNLHE